VVVLEVFSIALILRVLIIIKRISLPHNPVVAADRSFLSSSISVLVIMVASDGRYWVPICLVFIHQIIILNTNWRIIERSFFDSI